jgi:hypothetical protein
LNKALVMLRELTARSDKSEIRARPTSLRYVEQCWQHFRNVAHLWAAFIQVGDGLTCSDPESDELIMFLSYSELFRKFGEQHKTPLGPSGTGRSSRLLLDANETAKVPDRLAIIEFRIIYLQGKEVGLLPESHDEGRALAHPAQRAAGMDT